MTIYRLKCIALPTQESGLYLRATIGKIYDASPGWGENRISITEDNGHRHTMGLPGTDADQVNKWRTSDYFEVVDDLRPKDVDGKVLEVGNKVAFCRAGSGATMVVGKVLRFTKKQVEIEHEPNHSQDYYKEKVGGLVKTMRNFDAVAKV